MAQDFLQFCYVTNDFDRAIECLRRDHDMGPFKEIRDHRVPTGAGRAAVGHFALAFKGGTQFEIIQPLAEDVGFYRELLVGPQFQMHFHHIGRHVASFEAYRAALTAAKSRWQVPIDQSGFGGHYAYADARADLGHWLELLCFPGESIATSVPAY